MQRNTADSPLPEIGVRRAASYAMHNHKAEPASLLQNMYIIANPQNFFCGFSMHSAICKPGNNYEDIFWGLSGDIVYIL